MKNPSKKTIEKQMKEAQEQQRIEVERIRAIVTEKIIPLLKNLDLSVEESKMFVSSLSLGITQAFNNRKREVTVKDLGIRGMINTENPQSAKVLLLLDIIEDETVLSALRTIEDFPAYIDAAIRKEMEKRKLSDIELGLV